jgi:hypothetical protein
MKFEMKYEMKCNEMKSEIWNDPPLPWCTVHVTVTVTTSEGMLYVSEGIAAADNTCTRVSDTTTSVHISTPGQARRNHVGATTPVFQLQPDSRDHQSYSGG